MNRLLFAALCLVCLSAYGQTAERTLYDYIEAAKQNSPLINDYRNQAQIEQAELQRLEAMYRHSRLEVNGDYLFVPIISKDGGQTSFKWNAQNATDYYGYDLGESSGHLHAGLKWTQPLLGGSSYKAAQEQTRINQELVSHHIHMEEHQLERSVTEHYLLCLLDLTQINFADSINAVLGHQTNIVRQLMKSGMAKQSDLNLLVAEKEANEEFRITSLQSYYTHLIDLNLLCGIKDTAGIVLNDIDLTIHLKPVREGSLFTEQYRLDSLSAVASLHLFNVQYKPQLNLFVDGGIQACEYSRMYKYFGWSAGVTFSWTIFDGRQKRWKERQARLQQNSIRYYKENIEYQRGLRLKQCLSELQRYNEREAALNRQLETYGFVLADYAKEMEAGQVSVLDYITVLRNKIQTERDCLLLHTNRKLIITTYNYWNY